MTPKPTMVVLTTPVGAAVAGAEVGTVDPVPGKNAGE